VADKYDDSGYTGGETLSAQFMDHRDGLSV
jgi:hypothetical protein